ncbi:hypothetical protein [Lysobacter panacisoli]|uniref:Uncharacterized protein n=1 Tax=Lysobacter panacisoli TaxID=1255263 RepID=A0ABP9LJ83_9GAMM|nr:hypothetical protein [Lysobacter panacisoli]
MALPDASEHASAHAEPQLHGYGRLSRRSRAKRAALRQVAVWTAVAALALIAQAVAPAAT